MKPYNAPQNKRTHFYWLWFPSKMNCDYSYYNLLAMSPNSLPWR